MGLIIIWCLNRTQQSWNMGLFLLGWESGEAASQLGL
jgi:hypothetical protein